MTTPNITTPWWKHGIIYQIYPRSFQDSNNDGIGDLPGITSRLDYLKWLGIDAIWLSPTFPSPMADFGYDVADYRDVHPMFGTLAEFDTLLAEAHARGIKLLLDLVPNHTSSEHPWFKESRLSRDNSKRDWYIWRDAKPDGSPPNNWVSAFGGSAWDWDETTGQYFLHSFLKEQPDLNYRNPDVIAAMQDIIRFWLERGLDGFRIDVIDWMIKDAEFRDEVDPYTRVYSAFRPEVHDVIRRFRVVFNEFTDRVMVGEINYLGTYEYIAGLYGQAVGEGGDLIHLPFNFRMILTPWSATDVRSVVDAYDAAMPEHGWPNYVLGNHDQHRVASRIGRDEARVAAMMLLTLRGTPFIYYGDEIGMENVPIAQELVQDPYGINVPGMTRDPERTPMQWDSSPNAGFNAGAPTWLPVAANYEAINVARQKGDPRSMLALYRRLIAYRQKNAVLRDGRYQSVTGMGIPMDCYVYTRTLGEQRVLVGLNFTAETQDIKLSGRGLIQLSTYLDRENETVQELKLRPNEGVIIEL